MTSSPDARPWILPELDRAAAATAESEGDAAPGEQREWRLPELTAAAGSGPPAAPRTEWDEAFDRGRAEGVREGAARTEQKVRSALEAVRQAAAFIEASRDEFARARELNLECMALAVAQKLVQRELRADPKLVGDLVARAIELLPLDTSLEVHLHPADLASLGGELERMVPAGRAPSILWTPDPVLERGSFVVESPVRIVDGRTDVALRTLFSRLDHD